MAPKPRLPLFIPSAALTLPLTRLHTKMRHISNVPVRSVPSILDTNFEAWFKKACSAYHKAYAYANSLLVTGLLWVAEGIKAVFDQDPQCGCIIQGPFRVPAKHCTQLEANLIRRILVRYYTGDESKIPTLNCIGTPPVVPTSLRNKAARPLDTQSPQPYPLPLLALILCTTYIDNPLQRLFSPRECQVLTVTSKAGLPLSVLIKPISMLFVSLMMRLARGSQSLEERTGPSILLELVFFYRPNMVYALMHECYWKLWFGDDRSLPPTNLRDMFTGPEVTISEADFIVSAPWSAMMDNRPGEFIRMSDGVCDRYRLVGYMKAVFPADVSSLRDLLKLLYLSNGFKMVADAGPL
ncbi:hypothetical protein M407DRAFT_11018 [Tulasnella calospora MUT 4182]|uniref:Fatty acid synthase meander beta sheet domain-containing protein n=1 Tax=Tulasnella calospora MUT 4182 TaxID=1051891 RepID=A0A0C3Q7T7_9AGAM|nr:hypothetical protein M407DRAFT_11018 [Tulasnella calospora MUT 4182]